MTGHEHEGKTAKALPAVANQPREPEPSRDANVWRDDFYADVGLRIQMERKRVRMTQEEVAGELGISRASMANIENGRQNIPVDRLWKLAVILDVPIHVLLPGRIAQRAALTEERDHA